MEKRIERIISFDVMRIVAAFAVVFQHIGGQNWPSSFPSAEWELRNMWVSLAQWSVPMFIMISGALFLNPEKPLVIKKLYGKNLLRIVYTFLFWSAVYVICIEGFENGPIIAFVSVLKGPPHFWFLKVMIGLYILIPMLKAVVADRNILNYAVFVLLIDEFGLPALGFVCYFILGHYLNTNSFSKQIKYAIYILALLSFVGAAYFTSVASHVFGRTEGFFYDDLHPFMLIQTAAIFVFIKDHCTTYNSRTSNLIINFSNCSFGIYLVHPLLMHLCDDCFALNSSSFNPLFFIPVFAIIIFFLSYALVKAISIIPFLKKVVL